MARKFGQTGYITLWLMIIGLGVLLQPALTPVVLAHANVIRSDPGPNSVLAQAPAAVTIWFTEPLEPQLSQIQVLDSQGQRVDQGNNSVNRQNPTVLSVSLPPLPNGTYVVAWTNVSSIDGHKVRGSFLFSIGQPLDAAVSTPSAQPLVQSPFEPGLRWLSLLSILAVVGGLGFERLILHPILHREEANEAHRQLGERLARRMLAFIWPALGLFLLASLGQLLLQTMITYDLSFEQALSRQLIAVLFETGWGRLWLWRLALLLVMPVVLDLALIVPPGPQNPASPPALFSGLARVLAPVAGAGILLTLSLGSHAAATGEIRAAAVFNDYLHLLAAAFWVGGLFHFTLGIPLIMGSLANLHRRELLAALVSRFSKLAGLSVGILIVTGLYSAYAQVTVWPALTATSYGVTLLAKLGLILPLLALGALNLLGVRPRLAAQDRAASWLRRFVTAEAILAVLVLLPVGLLTALEPARQVASREGIGLARSLTFQETVEGTDITLTVEPGQVGPNRLLVMLKDRRGNPITNAADVSLRATYLEADLGESAVSAAGSGPGQYLVEKQLLSLAGPWQVELVVRRPDALDARTAFRFEVTPGSTGDSTAITPAVTAGQLLWAAELALLGALLIWRSLPLSHWRYRKGAATALPGAAAVLAGIWLVVTLLFFTPPKPEIAQARLSPAQPDPPAVDRPAAVPPSPTEDPLRNPYPPDAASLAVGQQLFDQNCTPCHGLTGRGDGPQAATLNPPPADLLTHIAIHPEIELFRIIRDGKTFTAMPSFAEKFSTEQLWHVVNYLRAFEADLRLAENYYRQGQGWLDQDNNEQALTSFSAALKLIPKHVAAYNDRGVVYRKLGQYEQALADHSRAIELKPDYAEAYFNRGVDYNESHQPDRAIGDYNRAIELDPGLTIAYYARGLAYADLGNSPQAIQDFNQALALYPDFKRVYLDRGLAYLDADDLERAYNDLNKYLELVPEAENKEAVANVLAQLAASLAAEPTQSSPTAARILQPGGN